MDEQDLIRKKIEKREKFDKILAYILLIILLACIGIVVYLKFFRENGNTKPKEYDSNYLTLEKIVTLLNESELVKTYNENGGTFTTNIEEDTIKISYVKGDENIDFSTKLINNELEINLSENEEFSTTIYKEIGKIVCTYYDNDEKLCKETIENLNNDNSKEGIRFVTVEGKNLVYINITKSIDINTETNNNIYTTETILGITTTDYELNIENTNISNIGIINEEKKLIVNGHITSADGVLKVNVKLYDQNDRIIGENIKEYTKEAPLVEEDNFKVEFELNDNLKLDDIKKYSINVVR